MGPVTEGKGNPSNPSNVIPFDKAVLRKRIAEAVADALAQHAPILTDKVKSEMAAAGIAFAQIQHGFKRAEILEFSEEPGNARMSFLARMMSAGEEFFVRASVQMVVPYAGMFVVIKSVSR
jgi:hypothetical protein